MNKLRFALEKGKLNIDFFSIAYVLRIVFVKYCYSTYFFI